MIILHPSRLAAVIAAAVLWAVLSAILGGCTPLAPQPGVEQTELYFPAPPDTARFVFERTVQRGTDLASSDEGGLRRAFTGETGADIALAKPFDVTVCRGTVYISDTVSRSVVVFDTTKPRVFEIGRDEPGMLRKPLGLATDDECNLYVADGTTRTVLIYDRDGQFVKALGGQTWFERLSHVSVDPGGTRIYAVDTGGVGSEAHWIRVFDIQTNEHLYDIGARGSEAGQFNLPRDITMGPDGSLYVVDGGNFRVQVFNPDGEFVREIGSLGRLYGQFARPKGVAVDMDGNVYVSDSAHGNFQIFDAQGELLLFVGSRSETLDRAVYMLPAGIDVDEDGRVYMVDQYFRKLDIFRPASLEEDAGYLGEWAKLEQ